MAKYELDNIKFYRSAKLYGKIAEAIELYESGESVNSIARRYKMNSSGVCRAFQKANVPMRDMSSANKLAKKRSRRSYPSGDKHPLYKGITRHESGYILIKIKDHPRAHKYTGFVFEHIAVAENNIGRRLKPDECVHHINGIKDDNRPDNLMVMTKSDHMRFHGKERKNK
jgi:hypothetical protein